MSEFSRAQYRKELKALHKRAEALRPAARAFGLEESVRRMAINVYDAILDERVGAARLL